MTTRDAELTAFAWRRLEDLEIPYLMLVPRYKKVRNAGAVLTRAPQIVVRVDTEGHRHILAVERRMR